MFWENLKQIIGNLPLILSDSYDPKDISINRVITILVALNVVGLAWYIVAHVEIIDKVSNIWTSLLTFLGVQTGAVNMIKRGIDSYKEMKGVQSDGGIPANNTSGDQRSGAE